MKAFYIFAIIYLIIFVGDSFYFTYVGFNSDFFELQEIAVSTYEYTMIVRILMLLIFSVYAIYKRYWLFLVAVLIIDVYLLFLAFDNYHLWTEYESYLFSSPEQAHLVTEIVFLFHYVLTGIATYKKAKYLFLYGLSGLIFQVVGYWLDKTELLLSIEIFSYIENTILIFLIVHFFVEIKQLKPKLRESTEIIDDSF